MPTTHTLRLRPDSFERIRAGIKTIELRLYDEKRRAIALGDHLLFQKNPDGLEELTAEVTALLVYPSFADLIYDQPLEFFGGRDRETLLSGVRQHYSLEQEKEFGVLGIRIKTLA